MSVSVVAAMVMLVGCTGGEPDPPPTFAEYTAPARPSATPDVAPEATTAATTPAITPPQRPVEMNGNDEAGATAAASYFLHLQVYVMATGDATEWDRIAWDQCQACSAIRSEVARVYSEDGHFALSKISISRVEAGPRNPTLGGYPVEVDYGIEWGAELDVAGNEVATALDESGTLIVDVLFGRDGWTLMEISDGAA